MLTDGIHDLNADAYYADELSDEPTLNATVAKLLIHASPRHAWQQHPKLNPAYQSKAEKRFDVGSAAHEIFLLDNTEKVAVVEAADWRSKAAQAARDQAREEGKVPLLADQWTDVYAMLDALRLQIPGLELDPPMFLDGKPEQTIVWTDKYGVRCRARLDYLHDDYRAVDDLKTCKGSAGPWSWAARTLWGMHAEIQAALTVRGIKKLTGVDTDFRFLAVETSPPYGICPVRLSPAAREMADHQVDRALLKWSRCLESDIWPSYPPVIVDAEPPGWAEQRMWDAEAWDEAA